MLIGDVRAFSEGIAQSDDVAFLEIGLVAETIFINCYRKFEIRETLCRHWIRKGCRRNVPDDSLLYSVRSTEKQVRTALILFCLQDAQGRIGSSQRDNNREGKGYCLKGVLPFLLGGFYFFCCPETVDYKEADYRNNKIESEAVNSESAQENIAFLGDIISKLGLTEP